VREAPHDFWTDLYSYYGYGRSGRRGTFTDLSVLRRPAVRAPGRAVVRLANPNDDDRFDLDTGGFDVDEGGSRADLPHRSRQLLGGPAAW